jgi:hypothetical protein
MGTLTPTKTVARPVACGPGTRTEWILPVDEIGVTEIAWASPEELCVECTDCGLEIGPAVPGLLAHVPKTSTTIPYEVVLKDKPTGRSMTEFLGRATWLLRKAAERQGIFVGLCPDVRRPPCACGCTVCVCGAKIDRTWLPDDVWAVTEIVIDGIVLPELSPEAAVNSVTQPSNGTVTFTPDGWTFSGQYPGQSSFQVQVSTPYGYRTDTVTTIVNPWVNVGANSTLAQVTGPGEAVTYEYPVRRNWQITRTADGHAWLERLDPWATCLTHGTSCGCGTSDPNRHETPSWPQTQRRDLPATEACTWQISMLRGQPVPAEARLAVAQLACDLLKACTGQECRVPKGVTKLVRGNVTIDLEAALAQGTAEKNWGIPAVADFLYLCSAPARGFIDLWGSDPDLGVVEDSNGGIWPSAF